MKTSIFNYALLLLIPSLIMSCSVTKNKNSSESKENSELQKESEITQLKTEKEGQTSHLITNDSIWSKITFAVGNVNDTPQFIQVPLSIGAVDSFYLSNGNWIKINSDGSIEAKGAIKDVSHGSKKQTTKKDSTHKQKTDSLHAKEKYKYITKTITVEKNTVVTKRPSIRLYIIGISVLIVVLAIVLFRSKIKSSVQKIISTVAGFVTGV